MASAEDLFDRYRRSGDPADLGAVYDAVAADLFRAALALSRDAASAEDALQGTFLDAMEAADRWDRARPLRPWLFGILRKRILEDRRRERRAPDPARLPPPRAPADPALLAADRELEAEVLRALEDLPEPYREVAVLRWRYGLEPAAIADARRMPPGTVRSLLHRAQARMKRAMRVLPALFFGERPSRGLEGVREEVVKAAAREAAAWIGAGAAAAAPAGGILVGMKGAGVASALLLAAGAGAWVLVGGGGSGEDGPPVSGAGAAGVVAAPARGMLEAADAGPSSLVAEGHPLEVLVTDTTGRPLPGLRLEARRPGENRGIMEAVPPGPILLASTTTDPAGRALFTLLPEGSSSIAAAGGAWAGPSASALLPRSPGSPPLLLVLHPACGVSGTVRTADGRPAPGVRVFARDRASTQGSVAAEVRTDREGRYNLSGLCRGPCEIWAEPPAGVAQWARTVVLPGVDCADIVLDGGASLRIRFLEEGTGAPLPGARARVRWNPEPSVRVGRTPAEADLLAGEDGTIHLADAPEGRLELLHAAAPGCVSGNSWWGEGVEREPLLVKGLPLELEVRLPRAATVEGRILDPAGRPVAGATVHISLRGPRFWSQGPLQNASAAGWVSTGPDGSYRIERVPAGRALLHASSVSHRPPVEYREGREFEEFPEGMRMELAPGALLRRDLVLEREEFAFVEGCVVDDRGAPLEGVPIYAWGPKVSSGPGGGFRKAVRPGKEREIAAGWEGGPLCRDPIRLDLAQGEVRTGVRFTLADPIVLAGEVRDRSGAPVEEALVALVHESDAAAAEPWTCATLAPAPRGAFRFEGVRPDRIRLVAWGAGGRRGESEVIDLHAGPPPGSTDIVLGEAATPAVLEGIVVDEEGAPIAGAGVGWEHPGSQGAGPVRPVLAVTGGDGRFRIEEGRGKFPLFAFAPGFLPAVRGAATGGSPLTVALQRERSVEGIVVEEGSGRPLPGVLLRGGVPDPDQGGNLRHCVSTRSAADGTFRLAGFPAGTCTVFAASPWPFQQVEPEEWIPAERAGVEAGRRDLRIELRRGLALAGRVVDGEGNPLAVAVSVSVLRAGSGGLPWTRAQGRPDGTFRVPGLEPGTYRAWFQPLANAGPTGWTGVDREGLQAGEEDLRIPLAPAHVIAGRVLDAAGRPAGSGCRVLVIAEDSNGGGQGIGTGEDGSFRTSVLDPRRPFLLVAIREEDGGAAVLRGVCSGPGEVEIRLTAGRRLEGRLLGSDGRPAGPGVPVRILALLPTGETFPLDYRTESDPGGAFLFEGLPDLPWRLTAGGTDAEGRPADWLPLEREEPVLAGTGGLEIRLEPAFSIRGRLLDAEGGPLSSGWHLSARRGGRFVASARPGPGGAFELRGLPRGAVTLHAGSKGRTVDLGTVELPGETPAEWRVPAE